jgi:hypothetical protein
MNTFPRWVMAGLGLVFLALLAWGALFYRAEGKQLRQKAETNLQTIAQMKADQITAWRAERLGDAAVTMERIALIADVERWMADSRPETAEEILRRFRSLGRHYQYYDVLLADADGKVLLSLGTHLGTYHSGASQALAVAARDHRPVFTDLHVEADARRPTSASLRHSSPAVGNPRGCSARSSW